MNENGITREDEIIAQMADELFFFLPANWMGKLVPWSRSRKSTFGKTQTIKMIIFPKVILQNGENKAFRLYFLFIVVEFEE